MWLEARSGPICLPFSLMDQLSGSYCTISTVWPSGSVILKLELPLRPLGTRSGTLTSCDARYRRMASALSVSDRDVMQAVRAALAFGKEFDVLVVVDFDERQGERAVRVLEIERFAEAEEVLVEAARLLDIGGEQGNMRQAQDLGTLRL